MVLPSLDPRNSEAPRRRCCTCKVWARCGAWLAARHRGSSAAPVRCVDGNAGRMLDAGQGSKMESWMATRVQERRTQGRASELRTGQVLRVNLCGIYENLSAIVGRGANLSLIGLAEKSTNHGRVVLHCNADAGLSRTPQSYVTARAPCPGSLADASAQQSGYASRDLSRWVTRMVCVR